MEFQVSNNAFCGGPELKHLGTTVEDDELNDESSLSSCVRSLLQFYLFLQDMDPIYFPSVVFFRLDSTFVFHFVHSPYFSAHTGQKAVMFR